MAGNAHNSLEAKANLRAFCAAYLPDRHEIEVLDVFREQKRALEDRVFMTPTLLKFSPESERRIVGTLSQTQAMLLAFELDDVAS
ncbi:MAG: circadian clock KaiB family protein [Massilia sp.]